MEGETLIPRDQLEKSNCCRFCAAGGIGPTSLNVSFIPIYGDSEMLNRKESLDSLINRYLPIKVHQSDVHFPKCVCSTCFYSIDETIQFFDKISEGQKVLMKIINQNKITESKQKEEYSFSEENPLLQTPKRRGRPRKDPNKPKETKPLPPADGSEPPKPKRQCRPPARFGTDFTQSLTDDIKEENVESDAFERKWQQTEAADDFLTFQPSVFKPETSSSLDALECQSGFTILDETRVNSLVDLEKFNIIMDGDDELGQLRLAPAPQEAPISQDQIQTEGTERFDVEAAQCGSNPNESITVDNSDNVEVVENDSDASVRTIDMVCNRRKRKRKGKGRKSKKGQILSCPDCSKEFGHASSLRYHRTVHHSSAPKEHICLICGRAFAHKTLLKAHQYTHSSEKRFKCDECILKFKSRASLHTHKKSVHCDKKEFTCEVCGSQFNLRSSLTSHLRIHTGEKPFACEFCSKTFSQRCNLADHRRTHTGERRHKCTIPDCDKSFTTSTQLRCHTQSHSGIKAYLCSICGKGFNHRENFNFHLKRHTGEKPLKCPACPKQFIEPLSLKKHIRFHTKERPYTCPVCKKDFADPSNYAKHKKIHQDGQEREIALQSPSFESDLVIHEAENEDESISTEREESLTQRLIAAGMQIVHTDDPNTIASDGQMITILDTASIVDSGDGNQQYLYYYPDDQFSNVPIFTFTLGNSQQAIEVRATDEGTLQALGNLTNSGPIAFATVEGAEGGLGQSYFNIEAFDGTATFVPVMKTEASTSNIIHLPLNASEQGNEILVSQTDAEEVTTTLVNVLQVEESEDIIDQNDSSTS